MEEQTQPQESQEQPSVVEELSSAPPAPVNPDSKHQFDEKGLKYERSNSSLLVGLVVLLLAVLAIAGFLFLTDAGKELIGSGKATSSSTVSLSITTSTESSEGIPDERNFSSSDAEDVLDGALEDADSIDNLDEGANFEDIDEQAELGL